MKIVIDANGWLNIERAGELVAQMCPHDDNESACGHWCPHFGEPYRKPDSTCTTAQMVDKLRLCHGTVLTGSITDFRKSEEHKEAK